MSVRQLVLVLAAASLLLLRPAALRGQETPVFTAHSELVVLHVTVRDRKGTYVDDLSQDAFAVVEDGQAQSVKLFSDTDTPVTVGLLVDGSASMFGNRTLAVAGAAEFVNASGKDDELFALAFNEMVTPGVAPRARRSLATAASFARAWNERSSRAAGPRSTMRSRPAWTIWSRGTPRAQGPRGPERRRRQRQSYLARARRAQGIGVERRRLHDCAHRAGDARRQPRAARGAVAVNRGPRRSGRHEPKDLPEILRDIALEIRHTYTIGYTSTNTARDGGFRRVRVVVTAPPGRPLVVRSRTGYVAGRAAQTR